MTRLPTNDNDFEDVLRCPCCDGNYLHHGKVEVFDRHEDATATTHVVVNGGITKVGSRPSKELNNPSGRRHGLRITHWCEFCSNSVDLCIAQHKGVTFIYWDMSTQKHVDTSHE